MEFFARVNPKYFAAITTFMAQNDVRYYLNGISIEPHPDGGVLLVATDGHRMGVLHDPKGWCRAQIIVGDITKALLRACAKKETRHETAPAALWIGKTGSLVVDMADAKKGSEPAHEEPTDAFGPLVRFMCKTSIIDGRFPDWRRVTDLKRSKSGVSFPFPAINSQYIADVSEAQNIILGTPRKNRSRGVFLETSGKDCSIVVRVDDVELHDRFFCVIMPMRADHPSTMLPSFMPQEPVAVQPSTLGDERCDADIARAHGWTVGTRLVGDEGAGPTVIEITAVGESALLAKTVSHNGMRYPDPDESEWSLDLRDWKVAP